MLTVACSVRFVCPKILQNVSFTFLISLQLLRSRKAKTVGADIRRSLKRVYGNGTPSSPPAKVSLLSDCKVALVSDRGDGVGLKSNGGSNLSKSLPPSPLPPFPLPTCTIVTFRGPRLPVPVKEGDKERENGYRSLYNKQWKTDGQGTVKN